jgi:hypothetical protein
MIPRTELRALTRQCFWPLVAIFWFVVSEQNHPTLSLRIASTLIPVGASALYYFRFLPTTANVKGVGKAVLWLMILGTVAALLISVLYDVAVGPDPLRFTLLENAVMDIGFIGFHGLGAECVLGTLRLRRSR